MIPKSQASSWHVVPPSGLTPCRSRDGFVAKQALRPVRRCSYGAGRIYVGISVRPKHRWNQHWHDCNRKPEGYFHNALRKHGRDAFIWHIVAWFESVNAAKQAERDAIAAGFGHFNLNAGGDGNHGYVPSPETRAKMAAAKRGKPNLAVKSSNARRVAAGLPGPFKAQTHCRRGHELTPDNVYRHGTSKTCKVCALRRAREQKEKK